jgi:hypothetical protein
MKILLNLFLINVIFIVSVYSQSSSVQDKFKTKILTTTQIDTAKLLSDNPVKSPIGAVLRSAVLPGWGQFYNEQYLKGVFAFTLNAGLLATVFYYDGKWEDTMNENYRDRRNLFTWFFGAAYLLTLLDAYIDAYLFGFKEVFEIAAAPNYRTGKIWNISVNLKIQF